MEMMSKKQLVAFMLVALLIASQEMTGDVGVGVGADKCDTPFWRCAGVCYKPGRCNQCCKKIGYLRGKCDFWKGMECLCCHEDHNAGGGSSLQHRPALPKLPN